MTRSSGRLWPLWLYPLIAVATVAGMRASLAFSPADARRDQSLGASWLAFFAILTLPVYFVAVVAIARRLRALPTRRVALVAVSSAGAIPLFVVLGWLAGRALHFAGASGLADVSFIGAAVFAPLPAVLSCYVLVSRLRPAAERRAD